MRILVTGGTGTFGRAFIRKTLAEAAGSGGLQRLKGVISYSRDEQKAAAVTSEFGHHAPFKAFIGDVRDRRRLEMAFQGVDCVVHAAALKRVDAAAYSPSEVIATNIDGTMNVVDAAIECGVKKVVVLSSDKAVQATNIYGATKYVAEMYAAQANSYGYPQGTRIAAVRYGNILGSRGSVYHTWYAQVSKSQPLTITDQRMTRFIMTIEQAVELVSWTLQNMVGGEVVVPSLPSASVVDLARAVAPNDSYPTVVTQVRPGGEKLHESLLGVEEVTRTLKLGSHYIVMPTHHDWVHRSLWTGDALPEGFEYTSARNERWLAAPELRALIAGTEACW